jgi:Rhodanese-like domain
MFYHVPLSISNFLLSPFLSSFSLHFPLPSLPSHIGFMMQASRSGNDLGRLEMAMDVEKPKPLLPVIDGEKPDLWYISGEVMIRLLRKEFSALFDQVIVLDCRYDYEFDGGHIRGALSVPCLERVRELFMSPPQACHRTALIFHCEFSSQRGPKCLRELRELDRKVNGTENYPHLYYPHCYLLDGGYRKFFRQHKDPEFCDPCNYIEMYDKRYADRLKASRVEKTSKKSRQQRDWRSKSFSGLSALSRRPNVRALRLTTSTENFLQLNLPATTAACASTTAAAAAADDASPPSTTAHAATALLKTSDGVRRPHSSCDSYERVVTPNMPNTPKPALSKQAAGASRRSGKKTSSSVRARSHTVALPKLVFGDELSSLSSSDYCSSRRGVTSTSTSTAAADRHPRSSTASAHVHLTTPMSPMLAALGRTLSATTISSPPVNGRSPRTSVRRHPLVFEDNTSASAQKKGSQKTGSWCAGMRRARPSPSAKHTNGALRRTRARNKLASSSARVPTIASSAVVSASTSAAAADSTQISTQSWAARSLETISDLPMPATSRW